MGQFLPKKVINRPGQAGGQTGPQGPAGANGANGAPGAGVATGGTAGQILTKNSSTNYDTAWKTNLAIPYAIALG